MMSVSRSVCVAFGSSITGYIGIRACLQTLQGKSWSWKWKPPERSIGSNCPKLLISSNDHFRWKAMYPCRICLIPRCIHIRQSVNLYADPDGIAFFVRNLSKDYKGFLRYCRIWARYLSVERVSGYFTDLVTYGEVRTDIGTIKTTDVKLSSDKDKGYFAYSGAVKTTSSNWGRMLNNDKLGKVTLTWTSKAIIMPKDTRHYHERAGGIHRPVTILTKTSLWTEYKQAASTVTYRSTTKTEPYNWTGSINTAGKTPTFNFRAAIDHFRLTPAPHTQIQGHGIGRKIKADFTGSSINDMNGEINVDSLQYIARNRTSSWTTCGFCHSRAMSARNGWTISSTSCVVLSEATILSDITRQRARHHVRRYIRLWYSPPETAENSRNQKQFPFRTSISTIRNTLHPYSDTAEVCPLYQGYFNDKAQRLREGYFPPRLGYGGKFFESGCGSRRENPGEQFGQSPLHQPENNRRAVNVALEARQGRPDTNHIQLGNNSAVTQRQDSWLSSSSDLKRSWRRQNTQNPPPKREKPALKNDCQRTGNERNPQRHRMEDTPSQIVVISGQSALSTISTSAIKNVTCQRGTVSEQPQDTITPGTWKR